jgi:hypothetical protein
MLFLLIVYGSCVGTTLAPSEATLDMLAVVLSYIPRCSVVARENFPGRRDAVDEVLSDFLLATCRFNSEASDAYRTYTSFVLIR